MIRLWTTGPWIISASAHESWIHILFRYLSHEFSAYCSQQISLGDIWVNSSTTDLHIWWLLLPHSWCDIDIKKQSPTPPTSIVSKPSSRNLECIKIMGETNWIVGLSLCLTGLISLLFYENQCCFEQVLDTSRHLYLVWNSNN